MQKHSTPVIFTDRSVRSMNTFLREARRYPVLTTEQEHALWQQMKAGSRSAREQLINSNLLFVVHQAKRYLWSGLELGDLVMTGLMGLTLAADRFDDSRGVRFISFAVWQVECELRKAVSRAVCYKSRTGSLDDPLYGDEDCTETKADLVQAPSTYAADWSLRSSSMQQALERQLSCRMYRQGGSLLADCMDMLGRGYTLADVARKHHLTDQQMDWFLDMVRQEGEQLLRSAA